MAVLEETKRNAVKNQLAWDSRVISTDINVTVTDSTATLTGTVPTYYEKMVAEEDAQSSPGILAVENNLTVSFPEGYTVLSDPEIKDSIDNMLLWDTRIDSTRITTSVDTGIVTLEGTVDAYWKKTAAEDIALSVSGVIDVTNNLDVAWAESYVDEAIADEVRDALRRSVLVNSENVTVTVSDGIVTLRGQASSLLEKRTAYEKAAYTAGVVGVNNQIEIV